MSKYIIIATVAFASQFAACAHVDKACAKVAVADDAYAEAMSYLRRTGILELCEANCPEDGKECEEVKKIACKTKEKVLKGQEAIYSAYTVCFDDEKEKK